jgi:hypothetical protein
MCRTFLRVSGWLFAVCGWQLFVLVVVVVLERADDVVMWLRKCGQRVCCPEGTNDGSQAIYCLERDQSRIRPVLSSIARMATEEGHGLIPILG